MESENNPYKQMSEKEIDTQMRSKRNKKYFYYFYFFIFVIISIYIIKILFSNNQIVWIRNMSSTPLPVPLPTAMNPNFLTQVNNCFIPTAAAYGYTLRITAGFRSIADQTTIYDQGRTVNGHIVTEAPPGHSLHNYGYAVDVADVYRGYNINWTRLVKIGAFCSLESSGVGDLPHFEERVGLTTDQFAEGMRPPPLTLPCASMVNRTATSSSLTLKELKACGAPKF